MREGMRSLDETYLNSSLKDSENMEKFCAPSN